MANVIKLKRGTSTPTTSDITSGEVALDTSAKKLYVNDSGTVKEIGGGGVTDGDKGDITISNSGATFTIDNGVVTYAKIQNVSATNRILGRDSSGAGAIEEITPANLRTMINVEDGATADQTASEIVALIADQTIAPSTIDMEDNEKIKLGTSDDLKIYHNTHGYLENITGDLFINCLTGTSDDIFLQASDNIFIKPASGEDGIKILANGAVELYEDDVKRFETTDYGSVTTGVHSVSNGIMEMKAEISSSHTLTSGYNAVSVDPTVASGVTVTVPSGATWSIV